MYSIYSTHAHTLQDIRKNCNSLYVKNHIDGVWQQGLNFLPKYIAFDISVIDVIYLVKILFPFSVLRKCFHKRSD